MIEQKKQKATKMQILMFSLMCAILPAALVVGAMALSPSAIAQQEDTSLGDEEEEVEDLAGDNIVSDVLDSVDDEEENSEAAAGDGDINRQTAIPIINQDQEAANLALNEALDVTVVEPRPITPSSPDTTAPVITVPADLLIEATNEQGSVFQYTVTAQDDRDGSVPVECTPPSGSMFPTGITRVECTAIDEAGNIGSASFTVTVSAAPDDEGFFCFYGLFETPCFNTEQECEMAHAGAREQGVALTECERSETPPEGLTIVIEEERSTCDPPNETGGSFMLYFLVIGLPADISDYIYAELVSSDGITTIVLSGWSRDVGESGFTGSGILTTLDVGEPPYTLTYYEATGPENPEDATIGNIVPLEGGRTASVTFTCEDLEADVPWIVIR